MSVRLRVENVFTYVEGTFKSSVKAEIDARLSYMLPDAQFAIKGWEAKKRKELVKKYGKERGETMELPWRWDGKFRFYEAKNHRFPTGFFGKVRRIMLSHNQEYSVVDLRAKIDPSLKLSLKNLTPRPYQIEIKDKAILQQRGIIELGTGGGKTEIMAMILAELRRPAIVLIHKETIFRQLIKRLSYRLGTRVGAVGANEVHKAPITVAMTQTILHKKHLDYLQTFPIVMADEAHHVPADTIYEILQSCTNAFYRYAFTATPWREDGKEMFLESAFGDFISRMRPTKLIDIGMLTKPRIFFLDVPNEEDDDALSWQSQYTKTIVNGHYRNRLVLSAAYLFWKLKKTCLIAVTQIKHGENLLKMLKKSYPSIRAKFIQGEDESQEKQDVLDKLDRREIDVVIATSVFGEGIDVPSLDCLINAKGQDSKIDVFQLIGRAIRKTEKKNHAYFIDFMDNQYYTKPHALNRMNVLKSELGYVVKKLDGGIEELTKEVEEVEKEPAFVPL